MRPTLREAGRAVLRGARRRCPRCGEGAIFEGWLAIRERCSVCDLRYLRSHGDLWAFLLLFDRGAFLFPIVVAYFFGWLPDDPGAFGALGAVLLVAFVATMPNRNGFCLGLDYVTRRLWDDLA